MRLIDEIEAAANDSEGKHPLCISEKQWEAYSLVSSSFWERIKPALLAGEDMADWIVSEDECGKGVASIALANAFRFRAATEGAK